MAQSSEAGQRGGAMGHYRGSRETPLEATGLPSPARLGARAVVPVLIALQTLTSLGRSATEGRWLLAVGLLVVLSAAWLVVASRRRGDAFDVAALLVAVGVATALAVMTNAGQEYVAGYGVVFVALFWYGFPRGLVPAFPAVVSVGVCTGVIGHTDVLGGIGNAVGISFFGLAALFWGRILETSQRNAVLVEELRETREAEQRHAVATERARLAREVHDVLAHTLSSLALHLESTRMLARSRDVDAEVLERLERAVSLTRTGLDEARQAVGTLRDAALPGPERIPALVSDFEATSGIPCRFEVVGTAVELPAEARIALFRAAQEALTNISKHAGAASVEVCLTWEVGVVRLNVVDRESADVPRGYGAPVDSSPGGGNGLRGMRERAELAGGRATAGPTAHGFDVSMWLPT